MSFGVLSVYFNSSVICIIFFFASINANQSSLKNDLIDHFNHKLILKYLNLEDSMKLNKLYCPAGSYANYMDTACIACSPGTYEPTNGAYCAYPSGCTCLKCPNGYICPSSATSNPLMCPAGQIANYEKTKCYTCTPGTYTSNAGAYCSDPAGCACLKCPNGYICPVAGTYYPTKCQAGQIANYEKTKCIACSPGTYTPVSGYYCSIPGCTCLKCPSGVSNFGSTGCL